MVAKEPFDNYSEVAEEQLNILENDSDVRLYNEILKVCHQIFDEPVQLRKYSSVVTTAEGLRFSTSVPGGFPYKVFWSMSPNGLIRIELSLITINELA